MKYILSLLFSAFILGCSGGSGDDSNPTVAKDGVYYYNWDDDLYGYKIKFKVEKSDGAIPVGYEIIYTFDDDGDVEGYNTKNQNVYSPTGYSYDVRDTKPTKAVINISYSYGAATEDYVLTPETVTTGTYTYVGDNGYSIGEASGHYVILIDGSAPLVKEVNATKGKVALTFDKPLDPESVKSENFTFHRCKGGSTPYPVADLDQPIAFTLALGEDDKSVDIIPTDTAYVLYNNYMITVKEGLKDSNGVHVSEEIPVAIQLRDLDPLITKSILESTAPVALLETPNHLGTQYFYTYHDRWDDNDILRLRTPTGWCSYDITDIEDPAALGCMPATSEFRSSTQNVFFSNPSWNNTAYYESSLGRTLRFKMEYASFGSGYSDVMYYDLRLLPEEDNTYLEKYYSVLGIFDEHLLMTNYEYNDDYSAIAVCYLVDINMTNLSSEYEGERENDVDGNDYDISIISREALTPETCYRNMTVRGDQAILSNASDNNVRVTSFDRETSAIDISGGHTIDFDESTQVLALNGIMYIKEKTPAGYGLTSKVYTFDQEHNIHYLGEYTNSKVTVYEGDVHGFNATPYTTFHLYDNVYLNNKNKFDLEDPLHPELVGGTNKRDIDYRLIENDERTEYVKSYLMAVLPVRDYLYTFYIEFDQYGGEEYYLDVTYIPKR